jgi:hypothetical protein
MKNIYPVLCLLMASLFLDAQPRTLNTFTSTNGSWFTSTNWSLSRVPQSNDSIVIPQGKTTLFDQATSYNNMYMTVAGVLNVKKIMTLDAASVVVLTSSVSITAFGGGSKNTMITIGGVPKFDENANYPTFGPSFANKSTGISPNGFVINSTLPVVFSGFYITRTGNDVQLSWSTTMELNNKGFDIQRSVDGSNWTVITTVPGRGNSNIPNQYSYTDKNMTAAQAYYRIRQADFDGRFSYTTIKAIRSNQQVPVTKVYACNRQVMVEFNSPVNNAFEVQVVSLSGQVMTRRNYPQSAYRVSVDMTNVHTGIYVVRITDGHNLSETTKIIL